MRLSLTLVTGVATVVAAFTLAWTAAGAPVACGPAQVGGATVRTWCGPAKATITWAGKTVTIRGGACELVDYQGIEAFTVTVGRYTVPRAKPKFSSFSAAGSDTKPGTYSGWLINFQTPGKQWTLRPTKTTVKITATGAKKGTFSGTLYEGAKTAKGSWTC